MQMKTYSNYLGFKNRYKKIGNYIYQDKDNCF